IYSTKPRKMRKAAMDRNYLASVLTGSGLS
ncbi:hypothetical protein MZG88_25670, partial [Escherichia coli]|nr:hypothetical protein [Escherichia coli]